MRFQTAIPGVNAFGYNLTLPDALGLAPRIFTPLLTVPENLSLNYLSIFAATVSTFVLGGLWYSPMLFGQAWLKEMGFTEETLKAKGDMARIMAISFVLELIMAFNLAAFIGAKGSLVFGVLAGAAAGFGWVGLSFGVTYLFERKSLRLFMINAGYHTVAFTLMGAILGSWN